MDVLVAGGSGFVGRSLCRVLADRGHAVTAASRTPRADELPAGVETASVDVTDPDLAGVVDGHDAVVNLVALPSHAEPRGRSHESVHLDGTCHLVTASERAGVDRFVQLSGLGVDEGIETAYFRAKRRAERVVRESELEWVLYRPSVVFGDGCGFLAFVEQLARFPVVALPGGGRMELQPIWVEDFAPMLADGVEDDSHAGRCYEIGGPERLTLAAVVRLVRGGGSDGGGTGTGSGSAGGGAGTGTGGGSVVVPIPMPLAALGATILEPMPWIPIGRDQYRVFHHDNTTTDDGVRAFGVAPESLRTLSDYLGTDRRDEEGPP